MAAILMMFFMPIIPQSVGMDWIGLVSNMAAVAFLLACVQVLNTIFHLPGSTRCNKSAQTF